MQQCIRQGCCQGNVFELTDDNYYRRQVFPMHAHMGVGYAGPAESVWLLRFWPDQLFLKVKT